MSNTNITPRSNNGQKHEPSGQGVNSILGALGAVLNKLREFGLAIEARNDDAAGALVIQIGGARLDKQDGKTRFTARPAGQPTGQATEPT